MRCTTPYSWGSAGEAVADFAGGGTLGVDRRHGRAGLLLRPATAGRVAARGRWGGRWAAGRGAAARAAERGLSLRGSPRLQGRRVDRRGADAGCARGAADRRLWVAAPHWSRLRALPLASKRALVRRHLRGDRAPAAPRCRAEPDGRLSASAGRAGPLRLADVRRPSRAGSPGR